MENETKKGLKPLNLSEAMEQEFFTRCFNMVDYLNAMATDIIMDFIDNVSGPLTKQVLRNSPEVVTIKAFISSGSNPAVTFPDTKLFLEGIKNLELFVNIDPNMTETGQLADYVLPACTFPEETGIGGFPYGISYCEPYIMLRRKVEYIDAQMHDVSAMRMRVPNAEAEINPVTAAKCGIINGELIAVETPRGSIKIKANVTQDIKPGVVSVPHGWAEANCKILLDAELVDPVSGYITLNSVACHIVKLA